MSRSTSTSQRVSHSGVFGVLRGLSHNLLVSLGFTHSRSENRSHRHHPMSSQHSESRHHQRERTFPSMPRDYIRRRRLTRRISNIIMIPLLSIAVAYVITRQPSGGFSAPKSAHPADRLAAAAAASTNPSEASALASGASSASTPAVKPIAADGYKLADGPYSVTEVPDIVLHDVKRSKDLHLRIFYPREAGPFPVIVFSHGAGGSQACCDALTRHWASYGYVTLQPTHDDSVAQRRGAGEDEATSTGTERDAFKKAALWTSRPEDISFVMDSLPALQNRIPALAGKLNADQVGVGGHSMGAFTADAIAGASVDLPNHPDSNFGDARVHAVLLLSPQGPGEFGLNEHSWDRVSIPLLSMTGSLDAAADGEGPDWKKIPFDRSAPGDKYHVFIEGANHMSFVSGRTLVPGRPAQGEMILAYTNSAALAFWDAYLKGDSVAKRYLRSDALAQFSHGAVKLYRR
jgi:predicted dienelactone hydrolase